MDKIKKQMALCGKYNRLCNMSSKFSKLSCCLNC